MKYKPVEQRLATLRRTEDRLMRDINNARSSADRIQLNVTLILLREQIQKLEGIVNEKDRGSTPDS